MITETYFNNIDKYIERARIEMRAPMRPGPDLLRTFMKAISLDQNGTELSNLAADINLTGFLIELANLQNKEAKKQYCLPYAQNAMLNTDSKLSTETYWLKTIVRGSNGILRANPENIAPDLFIMSIFNETHNETKFFYFSQLPIVDSPSEVI
jgi:hypothetical protein